MVAASSMGGCDLGGKAGAGGVIRDSNGSWITGFSMNVDTATSVVAELKGLRQGLKLALELGFYVADLTKFRPATHVYQEANTCADILAKKGRVPLESLVIYDIVPSILSLGLLKYAMEKTHTHPRLLSGWVLDGDGALSGDHHLGMMSPAVIDDLVPGTSDFRGGHQP
ncbi:hypothetical protein CRG98_038773 [Punica granatum]|uniref:RNase H type-1 domain-containing protein n=1 Tax=Punica granatum TaxID=22663 RepID=A0A2I0IA23_PUNGR|nr:hypothetical protein CRG98_038773 [Punica granatum]